MSGYEGASLNRIIRACGMSKSSFYHYFENKQELFEVVVARLGESLVAELPVPAPAEFAGGEFWRWLLTICGAVGSIVVVVDVRHAKGVGALRF